MTTYLSVVTLPGQLGGPVPHSQQETYIPVVNSVHVADAVQSTDSTHIIEEIRRVLVIALQ